MSAIEPLPAPEGSATFEWDLVERVERYSAAAIAMVLDRASHEPLDRATWMRHVDRADVERVADAVDRAIEAGDPWSLSYRLVSATGRKVRVRDRGFVVVDGGRAVRVIGVLERENVSGDARAAPDPDRQRLYGAIVNFIPQLCWAADASGWIDFYNDRWYEYTGTTPAQMEGWGWVAVHDPLDLPRLLKIWRNSLAAGEPWQDEFRLRRGSDGALRWHLSRAMPLRDESGRIVRWFGTNTDVHDQKLAAEEYSRLLAREQHLRREADAANRAKDEFLAVVSHELRTPLSVILNSATSLRSGAPAAKHAAILERIERNARLQAKLVSDLLDVSRIVAGKLEMEAEPVDLSHTAVAAVEAIRALAQEKGVLLSCANGPGEAWVRGDAARLLQATSNLLHNAVKFTPAGKRVHVEVRALPEHVDVVIRDEGSGIAPEHLSRLFRRFSQTDATSTRRQGGLGLGLAIVRELLDRQGGEAFAESEGAGRGSTFTLRMPRLAAEPRTGATPAKEESRTPVPLAGLRVLVVDDEQDVRATVSEMLLGCGATVSAVGSAREALHAFRLGVPDALVSDIAMPEIDGYELIRRIRGMAGDVARTPAVALTAYASREHREAAITAGFDAYLPKPTDVAALSRAVAELCRDRLLAAS